MDINTLRRIISEEKLIGASIYPAEYPHPDEVVMTTDGDQWTVGVTNKRAAVVSESVKTFDTEEEACDECLKKLRLLKKLLSYRND